ncbi:MAG: hypothetical protein MAG431_01385 [Chloroflexi bacterium]|nr:hypothetical protein [Chloroflexota bacterium]
MIEQKDILALSDQIVEFFHPDKIILFGSYAHGSPHSTSDVDLLVMLSFEGRNVHKAAEILRQTDPHFPIDLLVRTPEQVRQRVEMGDFFLRDILEKGKVLYETSHS